MSITIGVCCKAAPAAQPAQVVAGVLHHDAVEPGQGSWSVITNLSSSPASEMLGNWFLKSFVCLLSMIGEGESPQRSCDTSALGKKEKHVQKNQIVIYGGWIWPMEPKSFRCVCPSYWPKTLSSVFPKNLPKIELNSCIDRFLSCAVPRNQGYSSCISVQCVHPPRWASSSPWSSKPQWDGLQ